MAGSGLLLLDLRAPRGDASPSLVAPPSPRWAWGVAFAPPPLAAVALVSGSEGPSSSEDVAVNDVVRWPPPAVGDRIRRPLRRIWAPSGWFWAPAVGLAGGRPSLVGVRDLYWPAPPRQGPRPLVAPWGLVLGVRLLVAGPPSTGSVAGVAAGAALRASRAWALVALPAATGGAAGLCCRWRRGCGRGGIAAPVAVQPRRAPQWCCAVLVRFGPRGGLACSARLPPPPWPSCLGRPRRAGLRRRSRHLVLRLEVGTCPRCSRGLWLPLPAL